jgi:DNA-binding CsgD family transcriptional regulator
MQIARHVCLRRAEAIVDVLELIDRPAFVLDIAGRVTLLNPLAEALLRNDFMLSHGVLRAVGRDNDAALQRLVSAVLAPPFPSSAAEEQPVAVHRSGRRPLIVRALPTIGLLADVFAHTRALLLVDDLEGAPTPSADTLPSVFGLTKTEARLAGSLAVSHDLAQAAEALEISTGTARNHLKAIFAKTETHRQSELISLIHRISASWKT